jgi:hypothetical protein
MISIFHFGAMIEVKKSGKSEGGGWFITLVPLR